jgi:hypothetical protein
MQFAPPLLRRQHSHCTAAAVVVAVLLVELLQAVQMQQLRQKASPEQHCSASYAHRGGTVCNGAIRYSMCSTLLNGTSHVCCYMFSYTPGTCVQLFVRHSQYVLDMNISYTAIEARVESRCQLLNTCLYAMLSIRAC